MSQNLKLDPIKKDYVVENGSPIPSDRVEEATYYAITIPQGKWLYGQPGQGSYVYTLYNKKRTANIEQLFASYVKDAVNTQVIATGKASAVEVRNIESTSTGTSNKIDVTQAESTISDRLDFVSV